MARPKVIVTGGAGYIGSHTCVELIQSGFDPVIVDDYRNSYPYSIRGIELITGKRPNVEAFDCTDSKSLCALFERHHEEIIGVIHFAAYKSVGESMSEPLKYYQNNVGSLWSVIQAMQGGRVRKLVFSSSCTVYGQPKANPVTEYSEVSPPTSVYGWTKVWCEKIISDLSIVADPLEATILRYFNPIGAHPSSFIGEISKGAHTNLVPLIARAASGYGPPLTVMGNDHPTKDGTCIRDYIHVVDIAKAHVLALQAKPTTVNLGLGYGTSVNGLIERFEAVNGVKVPHAYGPRRVGDVSEVWCSPDKAMSDLGWRPEFSIDDALRDAWNWQKNLKDGI